MQPLPVDTSPVKFLVNRSKRKLFHRPSRCSYRSIHIKLEAGRWYLIFLKTGEPFIDNFFTANSRYHHLARICNIKLISFSYKSQSFHEHLYVISNYLVCRKVKIFVLLDNFPDLLATKRKARSRYNTAAISSKAPWCYRVVESLP